MKQFSRHFTPIPQDIVCEALGQFTLKGSVDSVFFQIF